MSQSHNSGNSLVSLPGLLVVFIVWWIVAANISDTRAPRTAMTAGYTNVNVRHSHIWFIGFRGCGWGDMRMWDITATNPQGQRVNFIVCGGAFKGNTIRVK